MTSRSISVSGLLLVLVAWAGSAARAEEPPLKVFVLAGTSNMTGSGARVAELPDDLKQPQKDVLVYQGGTWLPLDPGKVPLRGKSNFGMEVAFGQAMSRHLGQPIGIITGSMRTTSPDDGGYAQLVRTVKDAQKSRPIVIAGMTVQLFEASDAKAEELAAAFPKNLTRYIESARRDFGNAAMPFSKNRALPVQPSDKNLPLPNSLPQSGFPYLDVLRKAEATIALPGFRLIDLDDMPRGRDVHYDTQGILELGKRHAAAMIELLKADKAGKKAP